MAEPGELGIRVGGGVNGEPRPRLHDDHRLEHRVAVPATVDGPWVYGYDGTTTAGYNITTSEMGHLYYSSLGNKGYVATDGTWPQPGWGLKNTSPFINLQADFYWSGTEYSADPFYYAWNFYFYVGTQGYDAKYFDDDPLWRFAPERVSAVPVPGTMLLLASGLAGLAAYRKRRGRRLWSFGDLSH